MAFWTLNNGRLFFGLCLYVSVRGQAVDNTLPHPACKMSVSSLNCPISVGRYLFPGNFNVSLVPSKTISLTIYSGTIAESFQAFPARPNIRTVEMYNFNLFANDTRFPLNQLLAHVKHQVKTLTLGNVKLLQLTKEDLSGFAVLVSLALNGCQLTSLNVSVFHELGSLSVGAAPPVGYQPRLTTLNLQTNQLTTVDWSFLQPISNSITWLSFYYNLQLTRLDQTSTRLSLPKLTSVNFEYNALSVLPNYVYESLNVSARVQLYLGVNKFCPTRRDCLCCEMHPFVEFLAQFQPIWTIQSLMCDGYSNPPFPPSLDEYAYCRNPLTTTVRPTTPMRIQTTVRSTHPTVTIATPPSCPVVPSAPTTSGVSDSTCPCLELDSPPITINCSKGHVNISEPNYNATDSQRILLRTDNTMVCRTLIFSAHTWLLPRVKRATPLRHDVSPISVVCRKGHVTVSEKEPGQSEATQLSFATTGHLQCRLIFFAFLDHLASFL